MTLGVYTYGSGLEVQVRWRGRCVGHATCTCAGPRWKLCDLKVEEGIQLSWPLPFRVLAWLGLSRRQRKLRGQGIGTRLLERVLAEADAAGVDELWGAVVPVDLERWPGLLAWYERHGFTVSEPDGECLEHAVKKITRRRSGGPATGLGPHA